MAWSNKLKIKTLLLRGSSLLLPVLPLSLSAIIGLFQARPLKVIVSTLACFCFLYSAKCTFHYYRQIAYALQQDKPLKNIEDTRFQALIAFSIAMILLSAYLIRQPLFIGLTALLAAAIYYWHYLYGQALPRHLEEEPIEESIAHLSPTLQTMIITGEQQAQALATLAQRYTNHPQENIRALSSAMKKVAKKAQLLIKLCAQNEHNIRRLRAFFVVQLPEILSICEDFLNENRKQTLPLEDLRSLLASANRAFAEQSRALLTHDNIHLASKIDVLRQQLESSHSHD